MNPRLERLRALGHARPCLGGDGGSSSSATTTTNTSNATDNRIVADGGALVLKDSAGANLTLNTTDHGAIQAGMATAAESVHAIQAANLGLTQWASNVSADTGKTTGAALEFAGQAVKAVLGQDANALSIVASAYKGASDQANGNRTLAIAGLIVAGVLGLALMSKRK